MPRLCLVLLLLALAISFPATAIVRAISNRLRAHDTPPVPGQVKFAARKVPNTGGIAIFLAIAAPILIGTRLFVGIDPSGPWLHEPSLLPADLHEHVAGIQQQTPLALLLVACLALLHLLGLIDDRKPLGPWLKLAIMAIPAVAVPLAHQFLPRVGDTRLLTLLDRHTGGPWLSIAITALWFLVVTNALNFMDNMDGLAGGVATVAAILFFAGTLLAPSPQWFVAACLALLIGACLGFLAYNWPRKGGATIFMGDSGSLLLGFLLAFLTIRTTYLPDPASPGPASHWYAVLTPLAVLAVPLYDFTSVTLIRLSQGRSPFVGDLQHLSHRLVARGLSKSSAVVVICGFTAITGLSAIFLRELSPGFAILVGAQVALMLLVLAIFEYASRPSS
jgi:UDP-GlcNAc:undecaprenyl-phosphate/decaprenyl-phosphate GlcNAc-1-phosphate transferase